MSEIFDEVLAENMKMRRNAREATILLIDALHAVRNDRNAVADEFIDRALILIGPQ